MFGRFVFDPFIEKMLRPPSRKPRPLPASLASSAEDVTIPGEPMPLKAWLVRPAGPPTALVVCVHGWSSDAGRMSAMAAPLLDEGIAVLLVDLPGHGRTAAVATYNARLMVEDIARAADLVASRQDLQGLPLGILGYSFGGLGAYVSAARDRRWSAAASVAAPPGPMVATALYFDGKGLPGNIMMRWMKPSFIRVVGADPGTFDAAVNLPGLRVPLLVVHGRRDAVVPFSFAEAIAASAPASLCDLVAIDAAGHDDLIGHAPTGRLVARFFATHLVARAAGAGRLGETR